MSRATTFTRGLPREAMPNERVAIDIELFKADPDRLHLPIGIFACMSVAFSNKEAYLVEDVHDVPETLRRLKNGLWCIHNALFDLRHLRRWAKVPQRLVWDTMLVDQDLFGGYYDTFSLDDLSRRWLGKYLPKEGRDLFSGRETLTDEMRQYAVQDAITTVQCAAQQEMWMIGEDEALGCYFKIDEPALWAVLDLKPQRIDVDGWLKNAEEMAKKGLALERRLGLNAFSHSQVLAAMQSMGIPAKDTANETLEEALMEAEESGDKKREKFLKDIIAARRYRKAASTYGKDWVEKYVVDGVVMAGWRITGAETGRMACRDPNLQNIPVRHLPVYRTFFVASPRHKFLSADVSQQEPRFAAFFTGDQNLLKALKEGDVYIPVAREVLGDERKRRPAKDVFLARLYRQTAYGLARRMHIPEERARTFIRNFQKLYPMVEPWVLRQQQTGRKLGYVRTVSGRRVWLNPHNYQHDNNAVNGPIQGSAADHAKLALALAHREAGPHNLEFCVTMVVHDEITADAPTPEGRYKTWLKNAWVEAGKELIPGIPMKADVGAGPSWGEAKE